MFNIQDVRRHLVPIANGLSRAEPDEKLAAFAAALLEIAEGVEELHSRIPRPSKYA